MSWFSRFTERIRRIFRRRAPELEIPVEQPEVEVTPPITPEAEQPFIPEEEKEEVVLPPEFEEKEAERKEAPLSKVVTFEERIRGTRIKRTVIRSYSLDINDGEINRILEQQYDNGGNYVINVKSIEIKETPDYEEEEIDRGMPGSADVSP
jgi:hypothetical protein